MRDVLAPAAHAHADAAVQPRVRATQPSIVRVAREEELARVALVEGEAAREVDGVEEQRGRGRRRRRGGRLEPGHAGQPPAAQDEVAQEGSGEAAGQQQRPASGGIGRHRMRPLPRGETCHWSEEAVVERRGASQRAGTDRAQPGDARNSGTDIPLGSRANRRKAKSRKRGKRSRQVRRPPRQGGRQQEQRTKSRRELARQRRRGPRRQQPRKGRRQRRAGATEGERKRDGIRQEDIVGRGRRRGRSQAGEGARRPEKGRRPRRRRVAVATGRKPA